MMFELVRYYPGASVTTRHDSRIEVLGVIANTLYDQEQPQPTGYAVNITSAKETQREEAR